MGVGVRGCGCTWTKRANHEARNIEGCFFVWATIGTLHDDMMDTVTQYEHSHTGPSQINTNHFFFQLYNFICPSILTKPYYYNQLREVLASPIELFNGLYF